MFARSTTIRNLLAAFLMSLPLWSGSTSSALAHPHEFVTMKVKALFNENGAVTGMEYNWTFDEFFSAYAVEGQDLNKNGKVEQNEVDAVLKEVLTNIHDINYFTKFSQDSVAVELATAQPISARMIKRQLSITFEVPFQNPVSVKEKPLRYAIYDDEFYIAMQHADADEAMKMVNAPKGCDWELRAPTPDEDVAAFAQSLDKSQSGGTDLGQNFAEWVSISCK